MKTGNENRTCDRCGARMERSTEADGFSGYVMIRKKLGPLVPEHDIVYLCRGCAAAFQGFMKDGERQSPGQLR